MPTSVEVSRIQSRAVQSVASELGKRPGRGMTEEILAWIMANCDRIVGLAWSEVIRQLLSYLEV